MSWLIENTVVAGVAACLVWLTCRTLKPRPALAHLLWLLVLVKLLCPPVARWSLPVPSPFEVDAPAPAEHRTASGSPGGIAVAPALPPATTGTGRIPDAVLTGFVAAGPSVGDTTRPAPPGSNVPPGSNAPPLSAAAPDWLWLLGLAWALGSGAVLFSTIRGVRRIRRRRRDGIPAPGWLAEEVAELARRFEMRAPRVVVSGVGSAFVAGLPRPTLVWPADHAKADPTPAQRRRFRSVLAHELAHLRRGDHWIAWLEVTASIALWWHPLVALVRSRLRLQAELACDAWAVWAVPESRHAYAGALIDAIERESQSLSTVPVLAARPGARRAFEKRLLMILNEDVPRRLTRWAILPIAALSLTAFTGIGFAQEKRGEERQQRETRRAEREVLQAVNRQLRKDLGAKYQVRRVEDIDKVVQQYVEDQLGRIREDSGVAKPERKPKPAKPPKTKAKGKDGLPAELRGILEQARGDTRGMIDEALKEGLDEALREIRADEDLRRLGLTKDVEKLVEGILGGGNPTAGLENLLKAAMKAGLKEAKTEIRKDQDLRRLGLTDDVENLVEGILGGGGGAGLEKLMRAAMKAGLQEAKAEIRKDQDLRELGITEDVEKILEGILEGGDLGKGLEGVMRTAMKAGLNQARTEIRKDEDLRELGIAEDVEKLVESILGEGGKSDFDTTLEAIIRKATKAAAEKQGDRGKDRDEDRSGKDDSDAAMERIRKALPKRR